jgi:hypothetical protein
VVEAVQVQVTPARWRFQYIHFLRNGAEFLHKRSPKVVGIPLSLNSDEIEIHDRAQKICASW